MKPLLLTLGLLFSVIMAAHGQGYQAQYPYDPYNNNPQPTPSANANYQPPPSSNPYLAGSSDDSNHGPSPYDSLLSYGYIAANYSFNSFSNFTHLGNGNGVLAELSAPIFKPFYLRFAVNWISGTQPDGSNNFNMTSISAGGGAYFPIGSRFHIFAEMGAQYDIVNGGTYVFGSSEVALYARPGVRLAVTDRLELQGDITFNTTSNLNDRMYGVSGYYAVLGGLDLGFGVDFTSDVNSYHAGLRYRW